MLDLQRDHPLKDLRFAARGITLSPAASCERVVLRAGRNFHDDISKKIGLVLPAEPGTTVSGKSADALWIGPDEWLLIGREGSGLLRKCARLKPEMASAVDISHRNTAILLAGPRSREILNAGCPRDLRDRAFPVGNAARTVMGKAEMVLFRTGEQQYRVECWRSFAEYVWLHLVDAARTP